MATLTVYPDAHTETDTVDGIVYRAAVETWANLRAGAGTTARDNQALEYPVYFYTSTSSPKWAMLSRFICLFNTSALTSSAIISAAVLSIYGAAKWDANAISPQFDIYTSSPASNTALATTDYAQIQAVSQTGSPVTYANFSITGYNAFTFDATGRGNISKTGISKFGIREVTYDVGGATPTWGGNSFAEGIQAYSADQAGTDNDPKLTVTYTANTNFTATLTETLTPSDVIYKPQGFLKSLSDIITTTDATISKAWNSFKTFAETLTLSDVISKISSFIKSFTETITTTSSLILDEINAFFINLSESLGISDAMTRFTIWSTALSDTFTLSDTLEKIQNRLLALSETIGLTDALTKFVNWFKVLPTETLSLLEDLVVQLTSGITEFIANLSETITTSDTFTKLTTFGKTLSDILTATETWLLDEVNAFFLILTEEISLSDTLTKLQSFIQSLSETIGLTDLLTKIKTGFLTLTETFSLSDVLGQVRTGVLNLLETIGITDTISKITTWAKTFTDTFSISDTLSKIQAKVIALTETLTTTDVLSVLRTAIINLSETLNLSDTLSKLSKWIKELIEVSVISDIIRIGGNWWNRITKHTSIWTHGTKHTGTWTEADKHESGTHYTKQY